MDGLKRGFWKMPTTGKTDPTARKQRTTPAELEARHEKASRFVTGGRGEQKGKTK